MELLLKTCLPRYFVALNLDETWLLHCIQFMASAILTAISPTIGNDDFMNIKCKIHKYRRQNGILTSFKHSFLNIIVSKLLPLM